MNIKSIFNLNKSSFITTIILALLFCSNVSAHNQHWKGSGNWSDNSNYNGGPSPGAGDSVTFDNTSVSDCIIDQNVNVAAIFISSGYTGTIHQNGYTFTFTSSFTQSSGTFAGGTDTIFGDGPFVLSGGTFTSTAGVFIQTANFTNSGGTFNHNNGSMIFKGTLSITGSTSFYDLTFNGGGNTYTIGSSTTLTSNHSFNTTGASNWTLSGGSVDIKGNINLNNTYASNNGHTTTATITGTGAQTFTGTVVNYESRFPTVTINKASGTLTLANYITLEGNYTYTAGTIDHTTNSNRLVFISNGKTITVNAAHTVGDVEFNGTGSTYTLTTPSNFNIAGTLYFTGSSYGAILSGTIYAQGNINDANTYASNMGHTGILTISGTANQNLVGTAITQEGRLPSVIIAKSSGTLYLQNYITTEGNWSYYMGTVDYTTNANRVIFISNGKTILTNGAHTLGDVEFVGAGSSFTLTTPSAFNIAGTLYVSGTGAWSMYTGTINAKGNITVSNTYASNNGHSASINITGSSNQLFTGNGTLGQGRMPNIIINKTGGTLTLAAPVITAEDNWTYTAGTVDATTDTSKVGFYNSGYSVSGAFYNMTLADANRRTLNGGVTINNILALGTGNLDLNQNTISILNSATGAITYSTGYIKSEQTNNSSKIAWTINTTSGTHVYPFGTNGGVLIPFSFTVTSGNVGIFSVATYPTNSTCQPYPTNPDSVTHMRNNSGLDNSANTVKRFWQLTKGGVSGTATMTFTAASTEVGSITNLKAQRWNKNNAGWDQPIAGQTNPTSYSATVSGVSTFSPWTLSGNGIALPIQLISFNAAYNKTSKAVHTAWTTASEINNDYFTIQRTADGVTFDSIGTVKGAGNSNSLREYSFDDANPVQGVSYYRLLQTDFDGKVTTFDMVAVEVNAEEVSAIKIFPNPGNGSEVNIIYSDDNLGDNATFTISDLSGRTVSQTTVINEFKGNNIYKLTPQTALPAGIYFVTAIINNQPFSAKLVVK